MGLQDGNPVYRVVSRDLGAVTAYAAAVNRGYTGTKEEFETLMASYATVAQQAAESAGNASQSATDASQSATDAQTAQGTAQAAASSAQTFKSAAEGFAQSAQQSAQSASQSATDAESAKNTAVDAVDGFAAGAQQALDGVNQAGNNWKSLAQAKALDSEAYALGTRDGEDVGSSDPAYHNNAKYYAESVSTSAQTATDAAQTATQKASDAQASASAAAESARTVANKVDNSDMEYFAVKHASNLLILKEIETGYVTNGGNRDASESYFHSGYIPVSEGDVIAFYDFGGDYRTGRASINARFIAAYDSDKNIKPESGSGTSASSYTVPEGVSFIVCSFAVSYKPLHVYVAKNATPTAYEPGFPCGYSTKAETGRHYYKSKFDTTFYEETFELPSMSLCKNVIMAFSGFVYGFALASFKLSIGQGTDHFGASWIEIDKEKVYWKLYTSSAASYEFAHGLPFDTVSSGQISITIFANDNTKATLKIRYGGAEYTKTLGFYGFSDQPYFVKSEAITVKYPAFSVTCKDFDAPVFVFGDSYTAIIESTSKWTHYVVEDGFGDNFCVNAFPGANSAELSAAFANTLNVATPQKILWCLGMNDGSDTDASTPNTQWMTHVDNMLTVCNAKGIEPLFVTIPSVPSVNNEGKNAWIRSSGYRFADLASAVGATSSGTWEDGMLSSDNTHPSAQGAKAMYVQLVADLPDLFV